MFVVTIREFDRRAWVERTRYLDLGGNRFVALVDDATVFPTDAAAGAWAAMYRGADVMELERMPDNEPRMAWN